MCATLTNSMQLGLSDNYLQPPLSFYLQHMWLRCKRVLVLNYKRSLSLSWQSADGSLAMRRLASVYEMQLRVDTFGFNLFVWRWHWPRLRSLVVVLSWGFVLAVLSNRVLGSASAAASMWWTACTMHEHLSSCCYISLQVLHHPPLTTIDSSAWSSAKLQAFSSLRDSLLTGVWRERLAASYGMLLRFGHTDTMCRLTQLTVASNIWFWIFFSDHCRRLLLMCGWSL